MANDVIQIEYAKVKQVAQSFDSASKEVRGLVNTVEHSMSQLKNGGWITDAATVFLAEMNGDVLQGMRRLFSGLEQANMTALEIIRALQAADDEAAALLDRMMGGGSSYAENGGGLIFPIGEWHSRDIPSAMLGMSFPNTRYPTQTDILRRYLGGELTYEQANSLMKIASTDPVLPNFVDAQASLLKGDLIERFDESLYRVDNPFTFGDGGTGTSRFDVGNLDYGAGYDVSIGEDGLSASISGDASLNLLRYRASAEYNGLQGTFDARVGLGASGKAELEFNPFEGKVEAQLKGEAFVGVEATASGSYSNDFFTVTGTVSGAAGVGARGHLTLDFDATTGKLKFSGAAMGTVGVGGGGGVDFELDVPRTAEFIYDEAARGVENLYQAGSNFLDDLLN